MIIKILILIVLFVILEEIIFDFNDNLSELKKYKPKINIILINGMILITAVFVFFITYNKYDINNSGKADFDDVITLKNYLISIEK